MIKKRMPVLVLLILFNSCFDEQIARLEYEVSKLKQENVPLKFRIDERNDNEINITLKFLTANGKEISKSTHRLIGNEVTFDFYVVPAGKYYISFPYKLFSDQIPPNEGILLTPYYEIDSFPQIFLAEKNQQKRLKTIKNLFFSIKNNNIDSIKNSFGSAVHDIHGISNFKENRIYKIITRTKGGIEIVEE